MTRRYRPQHADNGTSLILALIIVTAIATVMGVILSQEDTAIRSTMAMRDQAADGYSADGATQAMLNSLKTSGINCSDPTNPAGVTLGSTTTPFYVSTTGMQGSINAYAQCTPDPVQGASTSVSTSTPPPVTSVTTVTPAPVTSTSSVLGAGDPTLPSYALMATGSASNDYGIDFSQSATGTGAIACIENGSVVSNKNINILKSSTPTPSGQTLAVRLSPGVSGQGTATPCTSGTGVDPTTGSKLIVTASGNCLAPAPSNFSPTPCTAGAPTVTPPAAPPLPSPIAATNPAPVCYTTVKGGKPDTTYAAYSPGLYTNAAVLNTPSSSTCTNNGSTIVEWLSPGAYYFNFSAGTTWTLPNTMIAGTPLNTSGSPITGLDPTKQSTLSALTTMGTAPAACQDPDPSKSAGTVQGAELILGGSSTITATNTGANAQTAELCASSPTSTPPVAIWGLAADATVALKSGGTVTVPQQTLCGSTGCGSTSMVQTGSAGQAILYFKGYVYAPNAQLDLTLKNSNAQVFNWGVVVRDFRFFLNGSSPTTPFLQLPKPNTAVGVVVTTSSPPPTASTSISTPAPVVSTSTTYTIRYINVWTCLVSSLQSSGQSRCPSTGPANVRVRVLTNGSSLQVLSWNTLH